MKYDDDDDVKNQFKSQGYSHVEGTGKLVGNFEFNP